MTKISFKNGLRAKVILPDINRNLNLKGNLVGKDKLQEQFKEKV